MTAYNPVDVYDTNIFLNIPVLVKSSTWVLRSGTSCAGMVPTPGWADEYGKVISANGSQVRVYSQEIRIYILIGQNPRWRDTFEPASAECSLHFRESPLTRLGGWSYKWWRSCIGLCRVICMQTRHINISYFVRKRSRKSNFSCLVFET